MSTKDHDHEAAAKAAGELADLQDQTAFARATLIRVQEDLECADRRLGNTLSAQLREANEQLVLAMLRARTEADIATSSLEQVSRAAQLEALTSLPNRNLFIERFGRAIADAQRQGLRIAILFLDINDFQVINDTHGHAIGDQVLKKIAAALTTAVGPGDTVSRYGGDEFLILLAELRSIEDAVACAERVIAVLAEPMHIGEIQLRLSASIGISLYPADGMDANTLINKADAAMCRAHQYGLGSFVFHGEMAPLSTSLVDRPSIDNAATSAEFALAEQALRYAQLREANEQLVLAALSAQDLQAAAQQAQRRQSDFLAVLAHELRSPLAPIRTTAALLGRVPAKELPRLQAIIERQVKHLSRMVADLFDVSRVSTGKLRLEMQSVDMAAIIAEAVDTCRPAMDLRSQHFAVYVPARALNVNGDPVRLAQVLCNLLDNASKYTPEGGAIRLSAVVVDSVLVVTVSDNGIGIPASGLGSVFDPFVQDPRAVVFNGEGLGIGLTVVRQLVEAHGGSVVTHSAGAGLGSQFVISLPLYVGAHSG